MEILKFIKFKEYFMLPLKYYITENPLGIGFMAKTIVNNNYNVDDFVGQICQIDSSLDVNNVKAVLKALTKASEKVLSEGNSITVSEFLRITPVIKGSFESIDSGFNPKNNYIGINCTVLPTFINEFQNKVSVEKTNKPANMPQVLLINNNKDKENAIRLRYANRILGINFTYSNYKLKGIKIINPEDKTKTIMLDEQSVAIFENK